MIMIIEIFLILSVILSSIGVYIIGGLGYALITSGVMLFFIAYSMASERSKIRVD